MKTNSLFTALLVIALVSLCGNFVSAQPYIYDKDKDLYFEKDNPNKRYTGEYKKHYRKDKLKREERYINGKRTLIAQYFRSGILHFTYKTIDTAQQIEIYEQHNKDGSLFYLEKLKKHIIHGHSTLYVKGKVAEQRLWENGNQLWEKSYGINGEIIKVVYFKNNEIVHGWGEMTDPTLIDIYDTTKKKWVIKKKSEVDFSMLRR